MCSCYEIISLVSDIILLDYASPCNEINVMHFSFNFLRIKGLYTFEHYLLILRRSFTNGTWYIA
jgi:hypothetical protein